MYIGISFIPGVSRGRRERAPPQPSPQVTAVTSPGAVCTRQAIQQREIPLSKSMRRNESTVPDQYRWQDWPAPFFCCCLCSNVPPLRESSSLPRATCGVGAARGCAQKLRRALTVREVRAQQTIDRNHDRSHMNDTAVYFCASGAAGCIKCAVKKMEKKSLTSATSFLSSKKSKKN